MAYEVVNLSLGEGKLLPLIQGDSITMMHLTVLHPIFMLYLIFLLHLPVLHHVLPHCAHHIASHCSIYYHFVALCYKVLHTTCYTTLHHDVHHYAATFNIMLHFIATLSHLFMFCISSLFRGFSICCSKLGSLHHGLVRPSRQSYQP